MTPCDDFLLASSSPKAKKWSVPKTIGLVFSVFNCKTTQTFTHLQSVNEPKRKLKTDIADLAKRKDAKNPAKTKTKQQNTVGPKAISTKTNRRL